jgi:hypothetical protein
MRKVLGMFDTRISEYTAENLKREETDVLSNTSRRCVRRRL